MVSDKEKDEIKFWMRTGMDWLSLMNKKKDNPGFVPEAGPFNTLFTVDINVPPHPLLCTIVSNGF